MSRFIDIFWSKLCDEAKSNITFIRVFHNLSIINTLIFNFSVLPFSKAIKFPFLVGKKVKFRNIGDIKIHGDIKTAMSSIGVFYIPQIQNNKEATTIIENYGTITLNGPIRFHAGTKINVTKNAILEFKGYNIVGYNTIFVCHDSITIGYDTGMSWECEVLDTDFHPLKDIIANKVMKKTSPIIIGDGVFIGNNVCIMKGSRVPNNSVISSMARVSGSFKKLGENLLIVGNPATCVDKGYKMQISQFKDYM